jgi:hypothetical protein
MMLRQDFLRPFAVPESTCFAVWSGLRDFQVLQEDSKSYIIYDTSLYFWVTRHSLYRIDIHHYKKWCCWCHVTLHATATQPVWYRGDVWRNRFKLYHIKSETIFAYFLICMSTTSYYILLVAINVFWQKVRNSRRKVIENFRILCATALLIP